MYHDCIASGKGLSISGSADMSLSKLREMVKFREAWRAAVYGVAKSQTQLSDWTELTQVSREEPGSGCLKSKTQAWLPHDLAV